MEYTPISPFMRPISRAHLRGPDATEASLSGKPVNKWQVLRELSKAQAAFGVTERDLTVLQGLLSFYPEDDLSATAEMIVFPSNKTICERLNGMPCSTMRRHMARLIEAGLLDRRDSPNGKRYVRRHGSDRVAFGFDLTPLYQRTEEIARTAEAVRSAEERVRRLRECVSLMRRDAAALADFGAQTLPQSGLWDQMRDMAILIARALRRKLSLDDLARYRTDLLALLDAARDLIDGPDTANLSTSAVQIEQHQHNSKKESIDIETKVIEDRLPESKPTTCKEQRQSPSNFEDRSQAPSLPLSTVIAGCPTLRTFYDGEIRHWHQLHDAACHVRPAMGISPIAWEDAQRSMGPEQAAVVVVAMLERFESIRSPNGYLRSLASKAAAGAFSCGPMVMALVNEKRAA
ncbi:plasmid replication protein RepC [Arenibacterium halophilum]|uniref:Replication initiation protein RepC n=1 Tax=Arenibacterium halophilum TaxID=2583821 RepID=A0ABY2WXW9_9RHOB|nr:plasmid replication protein RepC [Arenibacterium halophilum]TMV07367.1 replication initiation protein RepC [Arenibacterium halophilum]